MQVSIVIPVYNRADIVPATLSSVAAQSYRPLQVVLVDNCSTDGTLAVLEQFKQDHHDEEAGFTVIVTQESHHTAGAARNAGFRLATGEWVLFFDSDDLMDNELVSSYVKTANRHADKGVNLISTRSTLQLPDGSKRQAPFSRRDIFAQHILHGQLATQRYAVRRDFFDSTDGWNIELPGWNDWELGLRLLLARPVIAYMGGKSRITVNHSGTDSITGTEFHSRQGQWEHVIDIMLLEVRCSQLKHKHKLRFERLLHYRRLVLAAQYQLEGYPQLAKPLCQQAYTDLRKTYHNNAQWRWLVAPVTRRLFQHIANGKRGAAHIARLIY